MVCTVDLGDVLLIEALETQLYLYQDAGFYAKRGQVVHLDGWTSV